LRNILILAFSLTFLSGCLFSSEEYSLSQFEEDDNLYVEKREISNVFFHNKNKFSISYLDENNRLQFKTFYSSQININIIVDVKANQSNWYESKYTRIRKREILRDYIKYNEFNYINIHIKNPNIISPADDKSGKYSNVMVQKIQ
jgi:hypothetical protein